MDNSKDNLVGLAAAQTDPHKAQASDFKVSGVGKVGETPGTKDALADFGDNIRHNEDGGMGDSGAGTPTGGDWSPGKKGSAFKVATNSGEGDMPSTAVKIPFSVDCTTGAVVPNVEGIRNHEA